MPVWVFLGRGGAAETPKGDRRVFLDEHSPRRVSLDSCRATPEGGQVNEEARRVGKQVKGHTAMTELLRTN